MFQWGKALAAKTDASNPRRTVSHTLSMKDEEDSSVVKCLILQARGPESEATNTMQIHMQMLEAVVQH